MTRFHGGNFPRGIATSGDFFDHPRVADAASDLLRDVFGIEKTAVRLVIGVASLPLGAPIELDVTFEVTGVARGERAGRG